jgi:hypothetical protein
MRRLGKRRRVIALILLASGTWTFFEPLISTEPIVVRGSQVSVFDLVQWARRGESPSAGHDPGHIYRLRTYWAGWNFWIDFVSIFPLMLFAIASLCFFPVQEVLAAVSLLGALVSFRGLQANSFGNIGLQYMLYGDFQRGRISCTKLWAVLLTVMVALAFVSFHSDLDG